jgi:hypothetical protein
MVRRALRLKQPEPGYDSFVPPHRNLGWTTAAAISTEHLGWPPMPVGKPVGQNERSHADEAAIQVHEWVEPGLNESDRDQDEA